MQNSACHARTECVAPGGCCRFLVDTPEAIWGALDAGNYLEAALRFLRASSVHSELTSGSRAAAVAARFPLLRQQWPLVANFRWAFGKPLLSMSIPMT